MPSTRRSGKPPPRGDAVDWDAVLADYNATVDWPACALWRELAAANPDAIILLSTRDSAQTWWKSASQTIFVGMGDTGNEPVPGWRPMWDAISAMTMGPNFFDDADIAIAGYHAHNAAVRAGSRPVSPPRVATGRRLGTAVPRAGRGHPRRTVSTSQHERGMARAPRKPGVSAATDRLSCPCRGQGHVLRRRLRRPRRPRRPVRRRAEAAAARWSRWSSSGTGRAPRARRQRPS